MGDTHAYLKGAALNLKPGDALLFAGADIDVVPDHWDLRVLSTVEADAVAERTLVTWDEPLGSAMWNVSPANPPQPFALRKRLDVFGHNAPLMSLISGTGDWTFALSSKSGNNVDLDGSHPDVIVGSWVVLSMPTYRELWKVKSVAELSRAAYATSGKVTRLELEGGENYDLFDDKVRETTVFAVQEAFDFADAPDASDVGGATIDSRRRRVRDASRPPAARPRHDDRRCRAHGGRRGQERAGARRTLADRARG